MTSDSMVEVASVKAHSLAAYRCWFGGWDGQVSRLSLT